MAQKDSIFESEASTRDRASFKPNSHISKGEKPERKIEKVTSGEVTLAKKTRLQRLRDIFFAENSRSIKEFVIEDVIVPQVKDIFYEIIVKSVGMSLFGEADTVRHSRNSGYEYDKVSYRKTRTNGRSRTEERKKPSRISYRDVGFYSRLDAEDVLAEMRAYLSEYDSVSILNFYEFSGVSGEDIRNAEELADDYGWYDLSGDIKIRPRQDGKYYINFPRSTPLD